MMRTGRILIIAAVANASLGDRSCAEPYRDDAQHFTVELPKGWGAMPQAILNGSNALNRAMKKDVECKAGFQRNDRNPMDFPVVFVQVVRRAMAGRTYEDLEASLATELLVESQTKDKSSSLIRNGQRGNATLDRGRNRIVVRMQTDLVFVGKVEVRSFGMLGADGIVYLHCYGTARDFSEQLTAFEAIADSFRFDPGYEFSSRQATRPIIWPSVWGSVTTAAVYGGAPVAIVLLTRRFRRRLSAPR